MQPVTVADGLEPRQNASYNKNPLQLLQKKHYVLLAHHYFQSDNAPSQRPLAVGADACEQLMFPIHFPVSQASCGRTAAVC